MPQAIASLRSSPVPLLLIGLIALGDWLFWGGFGGLALLLFFLAIAAGAYATHPERPAPHAEGDAALILILGLLPLLDRLQPLSVAIAALALGGVVLRLYLDRDLLALMRGALRLWLSVPVAAPLDGTRLCTTGVRQLEGWRPDWRVYLLPSVLGGVFIVLITLANPVVEGWLSEMFHPKTKLDLRRPLLWAVLATAAWPFLKLSSSADRLSRPYRARPKVRVLSAASLVHSLIAFNLLFAVQTSLDLTYLLSSSALPAGLTYAEYAQRGAYPLVGLALLAGVFMVIAMPFVHERAELKPILALWLGQTMMLTCASAYRLAIYIDVYGLTYLRIRAAIWMGLVLIGLGILAVQLWQDRARIWAILRIVLVAASVLYGAALVNFAAVIATWNLAERNASSLDLSYIHQLGRDAAVPVARYVARTGDERANIRVAGPPLIGGWREWGFRSARIQRRFAAMTPDKPQ